MKTYTVSSIYSTESYPFENEEIDIRYDVLVICPICKIGIQPVVSESLHHDQDKASLFQVCPVCNESYLSKYRVIYDGLSFQDYIDDGYSPDNLDSELISTSPISTSKIKFDDSVASISSSFIEIFNEAASAEDLGFKHIAGIAYRKALEFLIKDFAIKKHPDQELEISEMHLGDCINDYLENHRLVTLAKASAWIGNDEAHFTRKHVDKDIESLKAFIDAFVHYLGYEAAYEEATELLSRNRK